MPRADKVKRAFCERAFEGLRTDQTIWVRRNPLDGDVFLEEISGQIVNKDELSLTVRYMFGNGPRYFEIRVKELQ